MNFHMECKQSVNCVCSSTFATNLFMDDNNKKGTKSEWVWFDWMELLLDENGKSDNGE